MSVPDKVFNTHWARTKAVQNGPDQPDCAATPVKARHSPQHQLNPPLRAGEKTRPAREARLRN